MCYFHHYYSGCALMDMPSLLESRGCIKSLLRFIILGCIRISLSSSNIFQTESKYQTLIYYCLFIRSDITIYSKIVTSYRKCCFFIYNHSHSFLCYSKTVTTYRKSHLSCTIAKELSLP